MKKYVKDFLNQNDGVETIEFIALIAVAALLVVAITSIGKSMKGNAEGAKAQMESALSGLGMTQTN